MTFFFLAGPCLGKNTAKQIWTKGVEYAAQGDYIRAKTEFATALKVDPLFKIANYCGISFLATSYLILIHLSTMPGMYCRRLQSFYPDFQLLGDINGVSMVFSLLVLILNVVPNVLLPAFDTP